MTFTPYLHFRGTCREAMEFYAEVFGADDLVLIPYTDAPKEMGMPADPNRVLNGTLTLNGHILMGSDTPSDDMGDPQKAVSISHTVATLNEATALYDQLVVGGDTIMPLVPTYWSPGFGMLRDRFGTHWMISVQG